MERRTIAAGIVALLAILAVAGCAGTGETLGDAVEMRTYRVPDGHDPDEIRAYLRESLETGDTKLGTAHLYPDGSLVVTAPAGIHSGVEQLLADLEERGPTAPEPAAQSITLRYWALLGRPSPEATPTVPRLLGPGAVLAPVADELTSTYGPMSFGVLEELRLTSTDGGQRASVRGRMFEVGQRVFRPQEGGTVADITARQFSSAGILHNVETRIRVEPGQLVVLAQTAYSARGSLPSGWGDSDDTLLFFVVAEQAD